MWRCSALVAVLAVTTALGESPATAATPTVARLVGQTIITGVSGRAPSPELLARVRAGQVGGVVLFARNIGTTAELSRLVALLQAAADEGGNPPLLVAIDQEGGSVRRLRDGPPTRSAATMGRAGDAAAVEAEGAATAGYLRNRGINVDLAPVLDTPVNGSSFLGTRAFGTNRWLNAKLGAAFVAGLQGGGVAATAKHFPGLGTAARSTDGAPVMIETKAPLLDRRLLPFERAIAADVKLVMLSSAGYRAYDTSGRPAVLSRPIVTGLLRERLAFEGVVISDAMEAAALGARRAAAVGALRAGVDVLLYTNERSSAAGYEEVLAAVGAGTLRLATLRTSAARVAALKDWLGQQ